MENNKDLIWYVCYGSNLCYERFMCYITGKGSQKYNIKPSIPCKDQTPPIKQIRYNFNNRLYFAGYSNSWNGPVAYIEKDSSPNQITYGRAYLITKEQYEWIRYKEGPNYKTEIFWGKIDGYPVRTFTLTQDTKLERNTKLSDSYKNVIVDGLCEIGLSKEEAIKYIQEREKNE